MHQLNFSPYQFRVKNSENGHQIFDIVRRKFVALHPEEWVRQHTIHYLVKEKNYPLSIINVEKQLKINQLTKRADIVVFKNTGEVDILIECKAYDIAISQDTFDQIARYNLKLKANYLMVTNGMEHYFCQMDWRNEKYHFINEIPAFSR